MSDYDYEIGATLEAITNLAALTTPVRYPRSTFTPYSQYKQLGSRRIRGAGWASAEWVFKLISRAERDQLKTFCTGASSEVYIRTKTNDSADAYKYYRAIMVWPGPGPEDRDAGYRHEFVIVFQGLIEVEAPE